MISAKNAANKPLKEKDYAALANKRWYIQGFNACINYIFHAAYSGIVDMHETIGYGYSEFLTVFKKDYIEWGYLYPDLDKSGKIFLDKLHGDWDYPSKLIEKDIETIKGCLARWKEIDKELKKQMDKESLLALYQKTWKTYHTLISTSHLIEIISYALEPELKKKFLKQTGMAENSKEFRTLFNALLEPSKPSYVSYEQISLLKIARAVIDNPKCRELFLKNEIDTSKIPKDIAELLENHRKEFFYTVINYYHGEAGTVGTFVKKIGEILRSKIDIDEQIMIETERYSQNNRAREDIIDKYSFDQETKKIIQIIVATSHWQDDRKKYMMHGVYYQNLALEKVSKRFKIPLDILKRCLPMEITPENMEDFDLQEGKKRVEEFAVHIWREGDQLKYRVFLDDDLARLKSALEKKTEVNEDIHGTTASLGKAIGPAKICRTKQDLEQFTQGSILITSMTRPEFVPAMKLSAGIVTDEGGITCHAAIIARELKKPCIIGTKIATKVFKDGDIIEVNANHGIVRIIKKQA
jgi:phosphohistidine swiveling domain-containing protein